MSLHHLLIPTGKKNSVFIKFCRPKIFRDGNASESHVDMHWRDTITYVHIPLRKSNSSLLYVQLWVKLKILYLKQHYLHKTFNAILTQKMYSYNPKYFSFLHHAQKVGFRITAIQLHHRQHLRKKI